MNVIVTLEYRFKKTPDGRVWTQMAFDYPFWHRYLTAFDTVSPCARIEEVRTIDQNKWKRVDGDKVTPIALSHYVGPIGLFKTRKKLKKELENVSNQKSAFIMRVGSPLADMLQPMLQRKNIPYALEVVGDPWEVFQKGAIKHPLRIFMRLWFTWKLKKQCAKASCVSYVTDQALQRRYPAMENAYTIGASTIDLRDEHFIKEIRNFSHLKKMVYVGTLETLQKGPDTLIHAFANFVKEVPDAELTIVGDGRERPYLESLIEKYGITTSVKITGTIPAGDAVRAHLDQADLFVLPSRGEGLPRSMIEAMARGLPCIGTHIGGIAELISTNLRIKVGDHKALTDLMLHLKSNPNQLNQMAQINFNNAKKYLSTNLQPKRKSFYQTVKTLRENA